MKVGEKLQKARKLRKLTGEQLSTIANLPSSRIRAYECSSRTPKAEQLKVFADSLGVPIDFFVDHKLDNYTDYFQVFFELEDVLGLSVEPTENGKFILTCNDVTFESYLRNWYQKKMDLKAGKCTKEEYDIWCARFPISVADDMHAEIRDMMRKNKETE